MDKAIQSIRGMHDILPEHTPTWQHIESVVRKQFDQYSYKEVRMPLVEPTALFIRSIGEVTDIVEKEMYTFDDRNEESLTLRPEGTAGCVRAGLQHGLFHNQQQRLWYSGPMFRYEKPQKGRYRQFHQAGAEAFGFSGVDIEIELIALARRIFTSLDLNNIELQINSIGSLESRNTYKQALVAFYQQHLETLDDDSKRRLTSNPLRILDSKNPTVIAVNENAPSLLNYLDDESKQSFDDLQQYLTKLSIDFTVNDRLVRGLDYYNGLVFEWVSQELGAQGTVCAGGRYNGLLKQMGGRDGHACGFGIGLERLWLLFEQQHGLKNKDCDFFMCLIGENAQQQGIILAEKLRDAVPNLRLAVNAGGGSFKSQIKKADKSGAAYALILAEDELANGQVTIKPLRTEQAQDAVPVESLATSLEQLQTAILGAT